MTENSTFFAFNRITDIYRVIPDVVLITPSTNNEKRAIIGINSKHDLNTIESKNVEFIYPKTSPLLIKRFCILNKDLTKFKGSNDEKLLFNSSQYFLLRRMIELQMIDNKTNSISELAYLDWKYWKNKNKIIAFHCGKDYLKMDKRNNKKTIEIQKFMDNI